MISINHFSLPSLFAGKLHAILQRKYTKGRDYYDFIWCHSRHVKPNFVMLNHALAQTTGKNQNIDENDLKRLLQKRFDETDFSVVKKDIEVFLSDPRELRFFTKDVFMKLIEF